MPKIIKKRTETTKKEDMNETVSDIRQRLKQNQRTMVYAVGAFFLIIVAVVAFTVYARVNTSTAIELEYEGYKLYHGDPRTQAQPAPDRFQKALEKFRESYSTKKRPSALLYIANCNYELGKYDEVIKTLQEFNTRFTDTGLLPLSYYKMAMAYMKKGDMENALKNLGTISSIKDSPLQDMALMESGKLLESMGKTEEAGGRYKELVTKFPKSTLFNEAKTRLGEQAK